MQAIQQKDKRFVCIKGNTYIAYKGKDRLEVAPFDRPLEADEVEYFRKYPKKFVESLEVVEVDSQDSTFKDAQSQLNNIAIAL